MCLCLGAARADDGYGVFWTILHGLEDIPDYESALFASLRRRPSMMALSMACRVLNAPDVRNLHSAVHALARELSTRHDLESEHVEQLRLLNQGSGSPEQ